MALGPRAREHDHAPVRPAPSGNVHVLTPVAHTGLDESLGEFHRTEDVRFSPSGRVLAAVATKGVVLLFAVDASSRPIRIRRHTELHSASLSAPHGVDFLSEELIVVANRAAWLTFYRIPSVDQWRDRMDVEPVHETDSAWFGGKGVTRNLGGRHVMCGPGSVRVRGSEVVVSCNNRNTVTAHAYRLGPDGIEIGDGDLMAQSGLEIPDGIAFSRDGRWLAVSNHHVHGIEIICLDDRTRSGTLRDPDLRYPHGICFDPSGRVLYVADAGERYLHTFASPDGEWDRLMFRSTYKLHGIGMDAFQKTKGEMREEMLRKLEGGLKGIDVDRSGLVVTTCRHQTLRFFEPATAEVARALAAD